MEKSCLCVYSECSSKNNQGSFASFNLKIESVGQYQNDEDTEQCHVRILNRYFEVIHSEAMKNYDLCAATPSVVYVPLHTWVPWFNPLTRKCQKTGLQK